MRWWNTVKEWWGYPSAHVHRDVEVIVGQLEWTGERVELRSWLWCGICRRVVG